ncbi:MAG: DUF2281 domain-containing protein [Desulfosalsimonadaceae bacterium]
MNSSEKLYQTIKDFPESIIAEVLDFAEFLRKKIRTEKIENVGGVFLIDLKGGLETSDTLSGDPVKIQEMLRNEWT